MTFSKFPPPLFYKTWTRNPGFVCRSCGGKSTAERLPFYKYIRDTTRHIYLTVTLLSQLLWLSVISLSAVPATFANIVYEMSLRNQAR
jgi:hypothetical protein